MENLFGICPWNGGYCPGPEQCAPATFLLHHQTEAIKDLGQPQFEPTCPIADLVFSSRVVSMGMLPLLLGSNVDPNEPSEQDQALSQTPIDQ